MIETPQQFFLRIACALAETRAGGARALPAVLVARVPARARRRCSTRARATSSSRAASCSTRPSDDLEAIYQRYTDVALLSKFSGGIGLAYHRVRSRGSLIASTNGHSNGIVPWLKTLDASVAAVNQGGKRKGACCVYLEPWHADIEEFLELRDNTGDEARRTHNLNLANWVPDLFMQPRRGGRRLEPLRPQGRARTCPTSTATAFDARLRGGRGATGWPSKTVQGARPLRADDAHARPDRQRLDDLQGHVATAPATRRRCPAASSTSPTSAPRSSR